MRRLHPGPITGSTLPWNQGKAIYIGVYYSRPKGAARPRSAKYKRARPKKIPATNSSPLRPHLEQPFAHRLRLHPGLQFVHWLPDSLCLEYPLATIQATVHSSPNTSVTVHFRRSQICSKVFSVTFCSPISMRCKVESLISVLLEDC